MTDAVAGRSHGLSHLVAGSSRNSALMGEVVLTSFTYRTYDKDLNPSRSLLAKCRCLKGLGTGTAFANARNHITRCTGSGHNRPTLIASLAHGSADGAFRQFLVETALIEFGDRFALQLIAFVQERKAEGIADIAENSRVLRPGDDRAR